MGVNSGVGGVKLWVLGSELASRMAIWGPRGLNLGVLGSEMASRMAIWGFWGLNLGVLGSEIGVWGRILGVWGSKFGGFLGRKKARFLGVERPEFDENLMKFGGK